MRRPSSPSRDRLLGAPCPAGAGSQPTEGSPHPRSRSPAYFSARPHRGAVSGFFRSVALVFPWPRSDLLNRVHRPATAARSAEIGAAPRRSGEREGGGWRWTAARRDRHPGGSRPVSGAERRFSRAAAAVSIRSGPYRPDCRLGSCTTDPRQELATSGLTEPTSGCCRPTSHRVHRAGSASPRQHPERRAGVTRCVSSC